MAYNAISQADIEVDSDSDVSRISSPKHKHRHDFQQVSQDTEHIGGDIYLEPARTAEDSSLSGFGSIIRSMTSTSYEMVEEDDHDDDNDDHDNDDHDPAGPFADHHHRRSDNATSLRRPPPLDTTARLASSPEPEPPLRTPISDQPVPLSHPIPDLQSLQGAYLGNVERLERSAEQMSATSTDIGSEIRKLDLEQKRRSSSGSISNTSRMSPTGSSPSATRLRSGSATRLEQVSEHEHDGYGHAAHILPPPPAALDQYHQYDGGDEIERPASAASGDTYQQAKVLFTDFDGVHYIPNDKASDLVRQISLTRSPTGTIPGSHGGSQTGENMVYYPAPVPRTLHLPPRLSRKPNAEREKRRSQLLGVFSKNKKSAAPPPGPDHEDESGQGPNKRSADLPPHLRASVFFDQPATPLDIEIKQASAVATLDSILDASAHAPVTAFTDHPFAGHAGSDVFGVPRHKASSNDLSSRRKKLGSRSTLGLDPSNASALGASPLPSDQLSRQSEADVAEAHESAGLRSGEDESGNQAHASGEEEVLELSEEEISNYTGPPNTLMAELEFRKHELQQRRRTAANTVGLHSTLLELEAVAQKQSEHRRQRPVTLAWEGPDSHRHDGDEDEDVPLAMLFPEKANVVDDTRPLGLMAKKQLEDSEPLSRRRARLRGEAPPVQPPPPMTTQKRPDTMYSQGVSVSAPAEPDSEDEGETLGQRLQRLRAQAGPSVAESDFAREALAEFRTMHGEEEKDKETPAAAEQEETLGALRARLHRESSKQPLRDTATHTRHPSTRRSIADMSQLRTSTAVGRQPQNEAFHQRGPSMAQSRLSMYQYPSTPGHAAPVGYPQYPEYAMQQNPYGMAYPTTNTFYSDAILGNNHLSYAMPNSLHAKLNKPAGVDPGQREVIDRWRQSIR